MLYLIPILIILDIFSKSQAEKYFSNQLNLIWDFFYLQFVRNPWIAFSIAIHPIILKILTTVIIIWIIIYYLKEERKKHNKLIDLAFVFVISWALGNAYERIFYWNVIDFIWVKYFSVFNFADAYISIWVILYLLSFKFEKKK